MSRLRQTLKASVGIVGAMTEGTPPGEARVVAEFAHDLKNPLSIAKGACESFHELLDDLRQQLARTAPVDELLEALAESVELVERNVARALDLAVETLARARGEARETEPVTVNDLIAECIASAQHEGDGVASVVCDLDPAAGVVIGSESHLRRAFTNLLDNALQAVAHRVERSKGAFDGSIVVRTRGDDEGVLVSVEDNGVGLPSHLSDGVVRAFETTKEGGTGLGLVISSQVAAEHGGELRLRTTPEGSTVAELWLLRDGATVGA